jgi:hydantoinase/carbamoylase family amidase
MSLWADLDALAAIGADGSGVSRFAWTPELAEANHWLADRMRAAGAEAEIDQAGNVIGRWAGKSGRAVLCGSHIDTVPRGGRFDGALGVLSALEAVRILQAQGHIPDRPIWLVAFNDEEGTRLRTSMTGSRAFSGLLDLDDLRARGVPELMQAAGFDFTTLADAQRVGEVGTYLELHIEQGPVLEQLGADVGIVGAISGLLGLRVRMIGQTNHAGTTPMDARRDAGVGAARTIVALRDAALADGDVMATVGAVEFEPGGANVVPGGARLDVDLRSPTSDGLDRADALVRSTVAEIAAEEQLLAEVQLMHRKEAITMEPSLQELLRSAADREGVRRHDMVSGAGHDAMILGQKVPTAMLFVPSHDGISHSPAEYTPPDACEIGARVLARALAQLTGGTDA